MWIEVHPADAMYDEPVEIRFGGFPANRAVTLVASATDQLNHRWESRAIFAVDASGAVNVTRQAPKSGTYGVADAMGLFWSMQLDPSVVERGMFAITAPAPVTVALAAELDGSVVATAEVARRFMKPAMVRKEVSDDGLVARFFHHEDGARPGVILFGGSGGGLSEEHPALLASHGYSVLSLAYFGMAGVPQDLMRIPLEYFESAIAWMGRNRYVAPGKLAVTGMSRGGELALLLGATFPEITGVIAYVPSGVVWPGIAAAGVHAASAWTFRGAEIPFVEPAPPDLNAWSNPPIVLTPWFRESMKNRETMLRAEIAVEKINGPVLMFSGGDDQMWPSLNLADIAMQRLMRSGFRNRHEHVSYAGSGHLIRFPYSPVASEIFHPVVRQLMALGGRPEANHVANLDSWRRMLEFLAGL